VSLSVGLYADSRLDIAPVAVAAEKAGLSHLWLYDSPLVFADTSMAALVAAQATTRISIGPGVANPLQRPPEYTAQMLATLNLAAPGRVMLGLGIGNSALRSRGLPPATIADMRSHIEAVRALLRGEDALIGADARPVRLIHPHDPWMNINNYVPIWYSAFGPKGLELAGELADGVLTRWEGPDRSQLAADVFAPGRSKSTCPNFEFGVVYAMQPIDSDDELETDAMRAALGPLVVSRLRYLTANAQSADEVPAPFRDGFVAYQAHRASLDERTRHLENYRGYLVFTPPDLERFVTPASMRTVALVGSPVRLAEELNTMATAGVTHVSLQMAGDQTVWCERMARQVFPLVDGGISTTANEST
jgi:alkanesulfonate monooxygenase SsuD/methylene tetrahydromethanopterin reductase-like flavin-dependent oxidoreductase (luciferase family)